MSDVESEARKYATVVNALAKQQQQPTDDLYMVRQRLSQVENAINEVTEDMDEMNERVNRVALAAEVPETVPEWESPSDFLSNTMEVVIDDKTTTIEGLQDLLEATTPEPVITTSEPVTASVVSASALASALALALAKQEHEQEHEQEHKQEEEEEEEEEEEDAVELKEFQHNGKTYFKDLEENVFQEADDEVPVGRWIEKKQTIKFYTKS
jgi:ribosomal protein L12E/L44/L45/RPP1/RPP2